MKIFFDVDTQGDFMYKDGALYVPDAESIRQNLLLLTDYAKTNGIPVLGSVDEHFGTPEYKERELELTRWRGPFPDHCMDNTYGQLKIWETTLFPNNDVKGANTCGKFDEALYIHHSLSRSNKRAITDLIEEAAILIKKTSKNNPPKGIYFEKQSYDVFTNPNLEILLKEAKVSEAVVYGVATDFCVKAVVLGLQQRGIQCYVVKDAIKGVFPESTKSALEEMAKAGAEFVTTNDVLEGRFKIK
jgi:nicotinamidase/pyrazinamidase